MEAAELSVGDVVKIWFRGEVVKGDIRGLPNHMNGGRFVIRLEHTLVTYTGESLNGAMEAANDAEISDAEDVVTAPTKKSKKPKK